MENFAAMIGRTRQPTVWGAVGAACLCASVVAGCADDSGEFEVVAGGGDDLGAAAASQLQLDGVVRDLAVGNGTVYVLAARGPNDDYLVVIHSDGSVTEVDYGQVPRLSYVAAGADGTAYAAGGNALYRVEDGTVEQVAEAEEQIEGLAVGPDGQPVWTEAFFGASPDDPEFPLSRIQRLVDGAPELVAGADNSPVGVAEVQAWEVAPPADVVATEFPLRNVGLSGAIAADDDGTVYAAGTGGSILRFDPDGGVDLVTGRGDRVVPDEPFADEGSAAEFGGSWAGVDMDASGGRLVAVDDSLTHEAVDAEAFAWSGDVTSGAQGIIDAIVGRDTFGDVAVVIEDGTAATVAAKVAAVAMEEDTLYLAGQTRSQYAPDAEFVIVAVGLGSS